MKKILILAALTLSMHSCKTQMPPEPYTTCSIIDYSGLTSDGFFVTESNSVSFDYEAIGSIYMEVHRGWIKLSNEDSNQNLDEERIGDDYYYDKDGSTQKLKSAHQFKYVIPDSKTAMSELKKLMEAQGADGILNLKLSHQKKPSTKPGYLPLDEYMCITGMLFKRK